MSQFYSAATVPRRLICLPEAAWHDSSPLPVSAMVGACTKRDASTLGIIDQGLGLGLPWHMYLLWKDPDDTGDTGFRIQPSGYIILSRILYLRH